MLLLTLLLACIPPVEYHMPEGTDLIELARADLRVNGESLGKWNAAGVQNGVHAKLLEKLDEGTTDQEIFFALPEDTPGEIVPVLLATAARAGHTQMKISQLGSAAVVGPISVEWVDVNTPDCDHRTLDPKLDWIGPVEKGQKYGSVFGLMFVLQSDKRPLPPIKVTRCAPGSPPASPAPQD